MILRSSLAGCFVAFCANAEPGTYATLNTTNTAQWIASTARIQPTDEPGAVAEVVFTNTQTNSPSDQTSARISLGDLSVMVSFGFNVNANTDDRVTITPPDGFIAIPPELTVEEGGVGVSIIYPESAVGS